MNATITIPHAMAAAAARKAGWPVDACPTAYLESRIDAVFTRTKSGDIQTEAEMKHLPMMAQLIHDATK